MEHEDINSPVEDLESQTLSGSFKRLPTPYSAVGEAGGSPVQFAAELLTALGHPTRIRIVSLLRREPLTVGQITQDLGISQANASQHLGVLLRAGALIRTSDGATRRYSMRSTRIAKLLDLVDEFRRSDAELVG